jgi:hypothetical protein
VANFLANTTLKEYGDCVNLPDGIQLRKLTDGFCLSAIKVSRFVPLLHLQLMDISSGNDQPVQYSYFRVSPSSDLSMFA